jgi:hypothetical protein
MMEVLLFKRIKNGSAINYFLGAHQIKFVPLLLELSTAIQRWHNRSAGTAENKNDEDNILLRN